MKERPILFSAPMVRAILDGHKTQTRRIIKDHKGYHPARRNSEFTLGEDGLWRHYSDGTFTSSDWRRLYGKSGDRLWVRETWWQAGETVSLYLHDDEGERSGSKRVHYAADGNPPNEPNRHYKEGLRKGFSAADPHRVWKKRSSIHMFRWASRIDLEITGIRVERLQDISEDDAVAEGIQLIDHNCFENYLVDKDWIFEGMSQKGVHAVEHPIMSYASLWESINGIGSWDANSWVWVIEFKRVTEQSK
jgi:hypothetical protein